MKTFILVAFLFCFSTYCYSQNKLEIRNSSIANNGYIQLRWAPVDFATFDFGRINGYQLIRTTIRQSDTILSGYQMYQSKVVLDSMILPLAEMDWESMADTNDMAGIAAMALYGEEVQVMSVDSVDFMEVANLNSQEQTKFGFGLFAADQSFDIALKMGLGYIDTTVVSGCEYSYAVIPNNLDSTMVFKPSPTVISVNDTFSIPKIEGLFGYGGDSIAYLEWNNAGEQSPFTSFMVERSADA